MKQEQEKQKYHGCEVIHSSSPYNILQILLISIRVVPIAAIMCLVILFQEYIKPHLMIPALRRYLSCIVNLFWLRIVLLLLGFFRFECQNYRYFDKSSRMLTFRSGWVGMASHKNFIDFLYFAYMFNPVFTRIIEFHDEKGEIKYFYMPLTFKQAFFASISYQGFSPIILQSELAFKRIKKRKMLLPTLISECFQETNGPILIMLPSIVPNEHIPIHPNIGKDIIQNQRKFLRSGVLFISEVELMNSSETTNRHKDQIFDRLYLNQLHLIFDLCSCLKINHLSNAAHELIKHKYSYTEETYSEFADNFMRDSGYIVQEMNYKQYNEELNELERSFNN